MSDFSIFGYTIQQAVSGALIFFGVVFIFIAGIGIIRMPDLYLRMSVSTKAATLGLGLLLLGTALHFSRLGVSTRAIATIIFVFLTGPVAAHMIGRAAYSDGVPLWERTRIDELEGQYRRRRPEKPAGPPGPADAAEGEPGSRDA
jgi:multicomponent Na+:H+ antiporter subunit G